MGLLKWSKSEVEYGRKILNSGLRGARSANEAFYQGMPLAEFLSDSVRGASQAAAVGACIGVLGSCPGNRNKSIGRALAFGLLGGAIGLGASVAWKSRALTASAVYGASRNIRRERDERWMKKHSIAYA